jgi:outer membrane protein
VQVLWFQASNSVDLDYEEVCVPARLSSIAAVQQSQKQAEVDLVNAVVVLEQARVRHEAALHNRTLAQQLLTAEQKKLNLGSSTPFNVIRQQRDLAVAEDGVVEALVAYSTARIVLDQTLGTTLESNHVSIAEARSGQASLPATSLAK